MKHPVIRMREQKRNESFFAQGLAKVAQKLFKASKEHGGSGSTVSNAWHFVAEDMEGTADTHKSVAARLNEDLVRPLKLLTETQHRSRKSLESRVDKRWRSAAEWRNAENKAKAKSYSGAKANERVQDEVLDAKMGRLSQQNGHHQAVLGEKELLKLESRRRKSEDSTRKADLDYYACCLKAERAR